MTVVVEQNPLLLGITSEGGTELLDLIHGGVKGLLVTSLQDR